MVAMATILAIINSIADITNAELNIVIWSASGRCDLIKINFTSENCPIEY